MHRLRISPRVFSNLQQTNHRFSQHTLRHCLLKDNNLVNTQSNNNLINTYDQLKMSKSDENPTQNSAGNPTSSSPKPLLPHQIGHVNSEGFILCEHGVRLRETSLLVKPQEDSKTQRKRRERAAESEVKWEETKKKRREEEKIKKKEAHAKWVAAGKPFAPWKGRGKGGHQKGGKGEGKTSEGNDGGLDNVNEGVNNDGSGDASEEPAAKRRKTDGDDADEGDENPTAKEELKKAEEEGANPTSNDNHENPLLTHDHNDNPLLTYDRYYSNETPEEREKRFQQAGETEEQRELRLKQWQENKDEKTRNKVQEKRDFEGRCRENSNILIDCDWEQYMTGKEIKSLSQQLMYSVSGNRKSAQPSMLYMSGVKPATNAALTKVSGADNWPGFRQTDACVLKAAFDKDRPGLAEEASREAEAGIVAGSSASSSSSAGVPSSSSSSASSSSSSSTVENNASSAASSADSSKDNADSKDPSLIPPNRWSGFDLNLTREKTVYLTADTDDCVTELDPDTTYIIGGVVDKNRLKNATKQKADHYGIRTQRLPITENMTTDLGSFSLVLTVNQVVEILLKWQETKNWTSALEEIMPKRRHHSGVAKKELVKEREKEGREKEGMHEAGKGGDKGMNVKVEEGMEERSARSASEEIKCEGEHNAEMPEKTATDEKTAVDEKTEETEGDKSSGTKKCPNPKCKCAECTCGEGCTCGVSMEVVCDECVCFKKAKEAEAAAAKEAAAGESDAAAKA